MASQEEDSENSELSKKLDKFLGEFNAHISKKSNEVGKNMIDFLKDNPDAIVNYTGLTTFIDGLVLNWVNNQNHKVSQYGIEALLIIACAMGPKYKNPAGHVYQNVIQKLGDHREVVREKAKLYLLKTIEIGAHNPNFVLGKLVSQLTSKNKDFSMEAQKCILEILTLERNSKLQSDVLNELLQAEIICLTNNLRHEAVLIIKELVVHIGKYPILEHLEKTNYLASNVLQRKIETLADDIRGMQTIHSAAPSVAVMEGEDEFDLATSKATRVATVAAPKPKLKSSVAGSSKPTGTLPKTSSVRAKLTESDKYALHSGPAGEADEAWFLSAFKDVPNITCTNHKEFENIMKKIIEDIKSGPEFWEKKVEAFKKLRAIIVLSCGFEDEIPSFMKMMSLDLVQALKDLRSQVVREACLTFAYLCRELKNKLDTHTCEVVLNQLMMNMMSSAKVIVTASHVTLKFLFSNVTHGRLLGCLVQVLTHSKSREVRTAACEFVELILITWPVHRLEQQIPVLQEGIRKGTAENTIEGRMAARRAFWSFNNHFPNEGDALMLSFNPPTKKLLMAGEKGKAAAPVPVKKLASPLVLGQRTITGSLRADTQVRRPPPITSQRSNSAIDLQAVQRAKTRQIYAAHGRQKFGLGSLPRSAKKADVPPPPGLSSGTFANERVGRTKNRVAGVSQSQPSSRSGSPSSRLGYQTYNIPENTLAYQGRQNIPRSQGTSREASPNRFGSKSSLTNLFVPKRRTKLGRRARDRQESQSAMAAAGQSQAVTTTSYSSPRSRYTDTEKMLAQSLEAENLPLTGEFNDGDVGDNVGYSMSPRKSNYHPFEDHSDDSDASSLCSDRSYECYRRTSDDITEIIDSCESTCWTDRKEGLVSLRTYLQSGNTLNAKELKRITDVFTRMFMDNHTKVFSLFLDTLNELISVHQTDLNSWLYVLLTRLLNGLGADLLGSIQNKILKSLDVVRDSFPAELQMSALLRFLTDPTQTPNLRVKTAALTFITKLAAIANPSTAFPPPSPGCTKDPLQAALHKMIGWTMGDSIKQGSELRRASQDSILALFNLNTPQVTLRLATLPQEYQEAAATLLKGRVRRGSTSTGSGLTTNSPPSLRPIFSSPTSFHVQHTSTRTPGYEEPSQEELYRVLRKTTAEIQSYTYETGTEKPPDKDNTTSKDSGISQLSGIEALEENMDELSLQSTPSSNACAVDSSQLPAQDCNGSNENTESSTKSELSDEQETMRKIVETLKSPPESDVPDSSSMSESEKRALLGQLTRLIREGTITVIQEYFKVILRILLGHLALDLNIRDVQTRILVLTALTELVKKKALIEYFNNFVELLILKVLNCYKDPSKEVVRNAESCANTIAMTLVPQTMIRVLAPLMKAAEFPLNLAAIKMLTKLVDCCGRDPVVKYLPDLMPGLIQAYDSQESSVRKSAVFCMVSLHAAIGEEELKPHLTALNGSKLKLLHLYIRRSQHGSPTPPSPRNHSQTASS